MFVVFTFLQKVGFNRRSFRRMPAHFYLVVDVVGVNKELLKVLHVVIETAKDKHTTKKGDISYEPVQDGI